MASVIVSNQVLLSHTQQDEKNKAKKKENLANINEICRVKMYGGTRNNIVSYEFQC